MVVLLLSSIVLSHGYFYAQTLLALQCGFYFLAMVYVIVIQHIPKIPVLTKTASLAFYFCLGNYGTLLGLIDFIRGKQVSKW